MKKLLAPVLLIALVAGCNGFRSVKSVFVRASPYDQYIESLRKAGLSNTSMTREWLSAGQKVFHDSIFVDVPFSESGFFQASKPEARGYRFNVKDGQVLTIEGVAKTSNDAGLFIDLFVRDDDGWDRIAYADSTWSITHEFSDNEECVLRLQPELLANTWYSIQISLTPVLINPVYGASNRSIGSFYGASRDNGARSHEGVDIFAPKGTPVVAPTHGYITRVGTSGLGGKVVWMKDTRRRHSYYFAHLDSQMVKEGMEVRQGHVLGLVGNTGNAIRTPPHLHFGIYQSGSKDPLYYIRKIEAAVATVPLDTGFQQKPYKVHPRIGELMVGPSKKLAIRSSLARDTYVTVLAQSSDWYRVALPDKTEGYVLKKQLVPLSTGIHEKIDSASWLLSEIYPAAVPVAVLEQDAAVEVLARFADYNFVKTENGMAGWVPRIKG